MYAAWNNWQQDWLGLQCVNLHSVTSFISSYLKDKSMAVIMRLQLATQQVSPEQHCQFSTYMKSLQNHGLKNIFRSDWTVYMHMKQTTALAESAWSVCE